MVYLGDWAVKQNYYGLLSITRPSCRSMLLLTPWILLPQKASQTPPNRGLLEVLERILFACLSVCLPVCLSVYLTACLLSVTEPFCLSVCLSVCLSACLSSLCLPSACLSVYPSVCLCRLIWLLKKIEFSSINLKSVFTHQITLHRQYYIIWFYNLLEYIGFLMIVVKIIGQTSGTVCCHTKTRHN